MSKHLLILSLCLILLRWNNSMAQSYQWAKDIGGSSNEHSNSIATDALGNVYIAGYFQGSVDFNPGSGTAFLTSAGGNDILIFPNPNNGKFQLLSKQVPPSIVKIFNLLGEIVYQTFEIIYHLESIDISRYRKGMYNFQAIIENEIICKKIIVE